MSTITFSCGDTLLASLASKALGRGSFNIVIDEQAQGAFSQINEQLKSTQLNCPFCNKKVERIDPNEGADQRFPLSSSLKIQIPPLRMELHDFKNTAVKTHHFVHFTRVEIANLVNKGRNSNDGGRTYQHFVELANDSKALISEFGSIFGRILYWLPTAWKASLFIQAMQHASEKEYIYYPWVISTDSGKTIGEFSLGEVFNEKFELEGELKNLKLFNIGVSLHSDFQRRGVVTELARHLFDRLRNLNLDIDGLWISTRTDNIGVNHIANKLDYTFVKRMDVKQVAIFSWLFDTYTSQNLYVKRL